MAAGAAKVEQAFKKVLADGGLNIKVRPLLKATGCRGFCSRGPLVVIQPEGIFYQKVDVDDVEEVIEKTLRGGEIIERLTYRDPQSGKSIPKEKDLPFYQLQHRLVLTRIGSVDPTDIRDTIAAGAINP